MSAWSFTRPGPCPALWLIDRFSSSRDPQPLQKRALRWFFSPQRRQWSVSLREGIARNSLVPPLSSFPSISLTSRMTKVLSKVREQNALRRLLGPPHRLIRTSVRRISHPWAVAARSRRYGSARRFRANPREVKGGASHRDAGRASIAPMGSNGFYNHRPVENALVRDAGVVDVFVLLG